MSVNMYNRLPAGNMYGWHMFMQTELECIMGEWWSGKEREERRGGVIDKLYREEL